MADDMVMMVAPHPIGMSRGGRIRGLVLLSKADSRVRCFSCRFSGIDHECNRPKAGLYIVLAKLEEERGALSLCGGGDSRF